MPESLEDLWQQHAQTKTKPALEDLWQQHQGGSGIDLDPLQPDIKKTMEGVRGQDPTVDYSQGSPFHVRVLAQSHSPEPGPSGHSEQELYLNKYYGSGNVRKDPGGQFLVRDNDGKPWTPVFPRGVWPTIENIGASAVSAAPTTLGAGVGFAAGSPAGPGGAVAGAIGGATLAKTGIEGLKALAGTYDKSPGQLAGETAMEAGLPAVFQGLPAAGKALTRGGSNLARDALQRWGGVTPESRTVAQSVERLGTNPPISSVAPNMKIFEYDRRLRNMLMNDPKAAERMGAINTRMQEVLQRFGIAPGPEMDRAMRQIFSRSEALSSGDAAAPAIDRLSETERGLQQEARERVTAASDGLRQQLTRYKNSFSDRFGTGIGPLGPDFEKEYTAAEGEFRQYFNQMYGAIDDMAGGHRYVDLSTAPNNTIKLIGDIFKSQGRDVPDLTQPLTYQEAHTIRSVLRDQAHLDEVSPTGFNRTSNLRYVQGLVDNAIHSTSDVAGKEVSEALKLADGQFAEEIKTFTNAKIKSLVSDIRNGRSPNPDIVANTILDSDSKEATQQMWSILPDNMKSRVQTAYMKNMFDSVTVQGKDGKDTIDPNMLLNKIRDSKSLHPFISDNSFWKNVEAMATNLRALGGDVDVTELNQAIARTNPQADVIRNHLERALGAKQALARMVEDDPRGALSSQNPELVRQGAKWFLGNEARTAQGAERLGVNSPEWRNVQRYAVQEMFKSALRPKAGLGETIYGRAIEDTLDKLTERQQRLLFGDIPRDDIRLLARQARALFPEMEEEFGGSLAAAEIKGGFSKGKAGFWRSARGYTVSMLAGRIADSPTLTRMLVGSLRQNPVEGKAMLRWALEGGFDTYLQSQKQDAQGTPTPDPMQFQGLQPIPKQKPEPNRPNLYQ